MNKRLFLMDEKVPKGEDLSPNIKSCIILNGNSDIVRKIVKNDLANLYIKISG